MKYYIISFRNEKTGETKEYYKCSADGNIKEIAIKLVDEFKLDKEMTRIFIYELKEIIYNGEY